jgi:hypothetical protein
MSSILREYTKDFSVSRPIFRMRLHDDKNHILTAQIGEHSAVPIPIEGDCLSELVCNEYKESFSAKDGKFLIDCDSIVASAESRIRNFMVKFVENNLPLNNPRQGKLYKWMYRHAPQNNVEFNAGQLLLYKYIKNYIKIDTEVQPHINNVLAMLDAMMEKYSEKT